MLMVTQNSFAQSSEKIFEELNITDSGLGAFNFNSRPSMDGVSAYASKKTQVIQNGEMTIIKRQDRITWQQNKSIGDLISSSSFYYEGGDYLPVISSSISFFGDEYNSLEFYEFVVNKIKNITSPESFMKLEEDIEEVVEEIAEEIVEEAVPLDNYRKYDAFFPNGNCIRIEHDDSVVPIVSFYLYKAPFPQYVKLTKGHKYLTDYQFVKDLNLSPEGIGPIKGWKNVRQLWDAFDWRDYRGETAFPKGVKTNDIGMHSWYPDYEKAGQYYTFDGISSIFDFNGKRVFIDFEPYEEFGETKAYNINESFKKTTVLFIDKDIKGLGHNTIKANSTADLLLTNLINYVSSLNGDVIYKSYDSILLKFSNGNAVYVSIINDCITIVFYNAISNTKMDSLLNSLKEREHYTRK